jgi:hypothetical protein
MKRSILLLVMITLILEQTQLGRAGSLDFIISFYGEDLYDYFGWSSACGDVNCDGYADLMIGAPHSYAAERGVIYVFFGGQVIDSIPDLVLQKPPNEMFGWCVSSGDVNGDGCKDIVAGAYCPSQPGKVYVYFGSETIDTLPDLILRGWVPDESFGGSVSASGDMNRDGYADIIVGSDIYSRQAYLYLGGSPMDTLPDLIITDGGPYVSFCGDVNGDNYSDIIVCQDKSYIYFGGTDMDSVSDVILPKEGRTFSSCGDLNGDGFDEFAVGCYISDSVWVFFGGDPMDSIPDLLISDALDGDAFGWAVADCGDLNQDGFSDFIVGAPNIGGGRGLVYFGGDPMDDSFDVQIDPPDHLYTQFGCSVCGADLNLDGFIEITLGAWENAGGGPAPGMAYIYGDITSPEIAVISPNGGEELSVGSPYEIAWASSDGFGVAEHTVCLSRDGGMSYPDTVAADIPGSDTSFTWVVSDPPCSACRIRVSATDYADNSAFDCSDSDFVITGGLFVRGDATGNMEVDVADVIGIGNYLFIGGGLSCLDAADCNDDGTVDIGDVIYLINYLYVGGGSPPIPFPDCDRDPTPDEIGCQFHPCQEKE